MDTTACHRSQEGMCRADFGYYCGTQHSSPSHTIADAATIAHHVVDSAVTPTVTPHQLATVPYNRRHHARQTRGG